jgi:hypothetical protein
LVVPGIWNRTSSLPLKHGEKNNTLELLLLDSNSVEELKEDPLEDLLSCINVDSLL